MPTYLSVFCPLQRILFHLADVSDLPRGSLEDLLFWPEEEQQAGVNPMGLMVAVAGTATDPKRWVEVHLVVDLQSQ